MRITILVAAVAFCIMQLVPGGMAGAAPGEDSGKDAGQLAALVAGNNEFAIDLYQKLSASNQDKNVFFSPLSISTALGMTYAGARGNTETQMAGVLHFGLPQDELHAAFAALAGKLNRPDAQGYRLKIANALWGQKDYPFAASFLDLVKKYYEGGFNTVDFAGDTEGSRQIINLWVEKNTAGKIKDLLHQGDISRLTRLVLTNAIYFKGDWAAKFKPEETRTAPFYVRPGETADVSMMHQTGRFGYAAPDGLQVLELPYAGGELSMIVLLPRDGAEDLDAKLAAGELNSWLAGLEEREVAVYLPKFKFEARYGLGGLLAKMGMPDAFDLPPADFSGMTGGKDLYISKVIHQAFIEVNEEGSEAAAATAVVMNTKSVAPPIPEFKADRPFVFLIRHKPTGAILFMGRVVNPI